MTSLDSSVSSEGSLPAEGSLSAEGSITETELEKYIYRLPERARWVFVLHAIEGYRHEEIAKTLNMAVGSSKAQFHRAKKLIKEWVGDE